MFLELSILYLGVLNHDFQKGLSNSWIAGAKSISHLKKFETCKTIREPKKMYLGL